MHDILFYLLFSTFICVAALLIIAGGAWIIVNIVGEIIRRYQDIRKTLNL